MYFVTIVCNGRVPFLAQTRIGSAVEDAWLWLAEGYPYVELDQYVIMPDHLHGIIAICEGDEGRGGSRTAPTSNEHQRKPLGRLVGAFKTVSTKRVNELLGTPGNPLWQRNYWERVIRGDEELARIRDYIAANLGDWCDDPENLTANNLLAEIDHVH